MRFIIIVLMLAVVSQCSETITNENATESNKAIQEENKEDILDYEFPTYEDISLLQDMLNRFSLHKENYILPVYYAMNGIEKPFKPLEIKFQISIKFLIARDLFAGIGLYAAYTQKSFFQAYSIDLSCPFRLMDHMPEVIFYKPIDWKFAGGEFYNIRLGYRHLSNGEGKVKGSDGHYSQSTNMILAELMYKNGNFDATLSAYAPFSTKNNQLYKYLGYSDLQLGYTVAKKHHFKATFTNLVHNYLHYKGSVQLEYKFDLQYFSIYAQYFYGYGDNIYQYNHKSNNIGIGIAIAKS